MTSFVVLICAVGSRTLIIQQRSFYVIINYVILTEGLSQKLFSKRMAQPFAMQICEYKPIQKKKPRKEAKKSTTKRGSQDPCFSDQYSNTKNWTKRRSKGTNRDRFFLFSRGCKVFQC